MWFLEGLRKTENSYVNALKYLNKCLLPQYQEIYRKRWYNTKRYKIKGKLDKKIKQEPSSRDKTMFSMFWRFSLKWRKSTVHEIQ